MIIIPFDHTCLEIKPTTENMTNVVFAVNSNRFNIKAWDWTL